MPRKSQISDLGSHDRSHHNDEDNNNNNNNNGSSNDNDDHDHDDIPAVATSYTVPTTDDQDIMNTNNNNNINNRPSSGYRLQQQETSSPRFAPDVIDYNNASATSPRSQKSGGGAGGTRASTFSSRHGNNRSTLRNSRVSDTGIEFRSAEPSATFFTTVVAEIASIIGAGILSVNQSALYMGFGNSLIILSFFWLVSMFSCYVLSVCSEYVGIFSQSQMLTACLCGGPQTIYDISIIKRYKLQQEQEQQQKDNTRASGVSLSQQQQANQQQEQNESDDKHEQKNNDDDNDDGERLPLLLPKVDSAASLHSIVSPDTDPYVKAVLDAQVSRNRINLSIDILNGLTYLLYIVAYSRALADSGVSISKDLNFPGFFQHKVGWLVIAGVIYLALSLRRVFAELTISCVFGVLSIMFVVLCIIIRYFDPFEIHYLPISDYPPAGKSGSDSFYLGSSFLQAFSVISSAYAYQVNHPPFYLELKQRSPANMQKTVVVSNTFVYLSYIVTVCFGLALFGSYVDVKEAGGNIVNVFSADDILINVARFMLMIHFVTVIPITICTTRQNFHRVYLRLFGLDDRADDVDEVFTVPFYTVVIEAVTAILIGLVLADTVPGIAVVIGICGALGGGVSIMILPGLCGMKVFSEFHERGFTGNDDDDEATKDDDNNTNKINQTTADGGMVAGVTPTNNTNTNNPQTPTIVRNQTSATPSNRVVGDAVDPPLQSESHHNNNNNSSLDAKIPDVLTSIYSNNLLGFCRFRLSNMTYYYMCAALVVVGTVTSIASLITILLSLNSS